METLFDIIEDFEKTYEDIDWDNINLEKELEDYDDKRYFDIQGKD